MNLWLIKPGALQLNYTEYRGPDVLISLSLGQHEGIGLKFPCNDRTDEVNKWYINWSEVLSLSLFCENNFDT